MISHVHYQDEIYFFLCSVIKIIHLLAVSIKSIILLNLKDCTITITLEILEINFMCIITFFVDPLFQLFSVDAFLNL
jgi:hypothetical protein